VTGRLKMPWGKGINLAAWCLYHTFLEQSRYTIGRHGYNRLVIVNCLANDAVSPDGNSPTPVRSARLPTSTILHGVTSQTVGVRYVPYVPTIEAKRAVKATSRWQINKGECIGTFR
jgi:hypothetical protein